MSWTKGALMIDVAIMLHHQADVNVAMQEERSIGKLDIFNMRGVDKDEIKTRVIMSVDNGQLNTQRCVVEFCREVLEEDSCLAAQKTDQRWC